MFLILEFAIVASLIGTIWHPILDSSYRNIRRLGATTAAGRFRANSSRSTVTSDRPSAILRDAEFSKGCLRFHGKRLGKWGIWNFMGFSGFLCWPQSLFLGFWFSPLICYDLFQLKLCHCSGEGKQVWMRRTTIRSNKASVPIVHICYTTWSSLNLNWAQSISMMKFSALCSGALGSIVFFIFPSFYPLLPSSCSWIYHTHFFLSSSQPKEGAFVANPQGPECWDLRSLTVLSGWLRCFYRRKGELPTNMPIRSNKCCGKESCLHFILKAVLLNLVHLVYTQDLPWVESDPHQGEHVLDGMWCKRYGHVIGL